MATLHIEHQISDLDTWLQAFNTFAPARERAGVSETRIWQPDNDPHYVVIHLRFPTASAASEFRTFLQERVWSTPEASPALVGAPKALVLNEVGLNPQT
jgi:hypothetical protein